MSWRAHGTSNESLVDNLVQHKILKSPQIANAMKTVDRKLFTIDPDMAYIDSPSPIGYNATISAPHMHAYALELLFDKIKAPTGGACGGAATDGIKMLDVGSGSGYLTDVLSRLVGNGKAIGIEHIPELVEQSVKNVEKDPIGKRLMEQGVLHLRVGDGWQGYAEEAPYDGIHVGAAAERVPTALLEQLKVGGRLVLPLGPQGGDQKLVVIDKEGEDRYRRFDAMGVVYVPLTTKERQLQTL